MNGETRPRPGSARGGRTVPRPPAWWTDADQAELDVLIWAFIDGFHDHRARCAICARGGPWCAHARRALELVFDWRQYRSLRTRAERLRLERLLGLGEAA